MTGRIQIAILLVSLAIGSSCSDADKSTLCFLRTAISETPAGTYTHTFTYQNSRPATWVRTLPGGETISATFIYSFEGIMQRLLIEHGTGEGRIDYGYDSLGRLKIEQAITAPESYTIHYKYNATSQMAKSYYVVNDDTTQITTYTYPNLATSNPSAIETLDISLGQTITHLYTYDNNIYPMRGLLPSEFLVNNIISDATAGGSTKTYTYQYNGAGYPVSAVTNDGVTQSWTYDCQEV